MAFRNSKSTKSVAVSVHPEVLYTIRPPPLPVSRINISYESAPGAFAVVSVSGSPYTLHIFSSSLYQISVPLDSELFVYPLQRGIIFLDLQNAPTLITPETAGVPNWILRESRDRNDLPLALQHSLTVDPSKTSESQASRATPQPNHIDFPPAPSNRPRFPSGYSVQPSRSSDASRNYQLPNGYQEESIDDYFRPNTPADPQHTDPDFRFDDLLIPEEPVEPPVLPDSQPEDPPQAPNIPPRVIHQSSLYPDRPVALIRKLPLPQGTITRVTLNRGQVDVRVIPQLHPDEEFLRNRPFEFSDEPPRQFFPPHPNLPQLPPEEHLPRAPDFELQDDN